MQGTRAVAAAVRGSGETDFRGPPAQGSCSPLAPHYVADSRRSPCCTVTVKRPEAHLATRCSHVGSLFPFGAGSGWQDWLGNGHRATK